MSKVERVTVYIDGQAVSLPKDKNLLEALLEQGVNLPYFCWHPEMGSVGACRQCAVVQYRDEDDDRGRIVMSCMTPVTDGALFSVNANNASSFRKSVVESLMINHPHDCPVCEEGGECHLQDMTVMVGHRDRRYRGTKVTFRNQYLGPFISHEMNRCITCYRCVRFYQDYAGGHDLGAFASRDRVYFGRAEDGVLENEFAGNLVEVCPTGVFTDKPLSLRYTRKWDLQSAPTICTGCSLGCNTSTSERYGELRRIHNRYNHRINGYFLCDRGRFGGDFVNHKARLRQCGIRNKEGKYDAVTADDAIDFAANLIGASARVIGIGSPRATLEANHALHQLVGSENFFAGVSNACGQAHQLMLDILKSTPARLPTMQQTEGYDAVLIVGEDVTNHAPRLALSLRQATRNRAKEMADDAEIPLWNDAAVRKLAQYERSPLIVMTPCPDRLDEVASLTLRQTPDQIAATGFAIANALNSEFPAGETATDIDEIVSVLEAAGKPLIVSGTGLQHAGILKAAANIAAALSTRNDETGLLLCADECNSIGLSLMSGRYLDDVVEGGQVDTAIIVENDLPARLSPSKLAALLDKVNHLIVLDHLDNDTTSLSELALPAATFAEAEGTLVNNDGTAQRSYAVLPGATETRASWHWLTQIGRTLKRPGFEHLDHVDNLIADCERTFPSLAGISQAAPDAGYRKEGMKIARMPPRYSGRTAINAHLSVHEPKPHPDTESPLTFSMEGAYTQQPSPLRPFVWWPGWNSNQSVNKFQAEIGGSYTDGDPGIRILQQDKSGSQPWRHTRVEAEGIPLARRHHIFGSEELSSHARAIAEMMPRPYLAVGKTLARQLNVESGDGLEYTVDDVNRQLEVIVDPDMADNCIAWPFGLQATRHLCEATSLTVKKAENWTRRESRSDDIIGSDRRR